MHYTPFVTVMMLLFVVFTTAMVGRARGRLKVDAPATAGNPEFERIFRVQQNTLEQMMLTIPALWLFAWSVSDRWAAAIGLAWIVARIIYARGYYQEAPKRGTGFLVSILITGVLVIGALIGTGMALFR